MPYVSPERKSLTTLTYGELWQKYAAMDDKLSVSRALTKSIGYPPADYQEDIKLHLAIKAETSKRARETNAHQ